MINTPLKRLPLSVLATALFLTGCVTHKPLPVEKVVLDWKDFEPVKFSPSDDCNTQKTNSKTYLSMKVLCFTDKSSLADDQFYLKFTETQYSKKQWSLVPSKLLTDRSNISNYLYQSSNSLCKGNYRTVSSYGYTCTPLDDTTNEDILFVHDYRKRNNGILRESVIIKSIPRNKIINQDDWQYRTAISIINDSLKKL